MGDMVCMKKLKHNNKKYCPEEISDEERNEILRIFFNKN
jgi:hypothetical protein